MLLRQLCRRQLFSQKLLIANIYFIFYEFPDGFLNNQLYWHFLYCFGFNLKENLVGKVNIYNQLLNFWRNSWRLHNSCCKKPQLKKDKNALVSCIWSFGSDQNCTYESKIFKAGSKYPSKECHNLLSSPNITFDGTKCALEFNKNNNVTNLIKDKLLHNFNNAFM